MRRISLVSALLLLGFLLAGCGGSSSGSNANSNSKVPGADVAPASALAYVYVNTNSAPGTQWAQAKRLLMSVPSLAQRLNSSLASAGHSLTDVERALGKDTVFIVIGTADDPKLVALSDPSDSSQLKSLLPPGSVTRTHGSWLEISDSTATLDQLQSDTSSGKLSEASDFQDAVAGLPAGALVKAYVSGSELSKAVSSAASSRSSLLSGIAGESQVKWAGLAARTTSSGLLIQADFEVPNSIGGATPTLVDELPSTTSFVVDLNGKALGLDKAFSRTYGSQLGPAVAALGITSDDISRLLGSEMALYGTESGFGLVIKDPQSQKLLTAIHRLVTMAGARFGLTTNPVTVGGVKAQELRIQSARIDYGVENGNLFFVTDEASLPGTAKLSDDPVYSAAAKELSIPSSSAGVFFVDFSRLPALVRSAPSLLQLLSSSTSTTPRNPSSLRHLSSLLGYISGNGNQVELKALLTLRKNGKGRAPSREP
jgi:hypothetical protein